jgi:hypothetical protein
LHVDLCLIEDDVLKSWEITYSDLEIQNPPIAKGAYGIVNKAIYRGTLVAVKTLICGTETEESVQSEFLREIKNFRYASNDRHRGA